MAQIVMNAAQTRALEQHLFQKLPGMLWMESAGRAAADHVTRKLLRLGPPRGRSPRVLVLCGPGNNGGDGFVAARFCSLWGADVTVGLLCDPPQKGDARTMYDALVLCDASIYELGAEGKDHCRAVLSSFKPFDAVIDAVFGIGLSRMPEGVFAAAIDWMNDQGAPVTAVDIPSGVDADTGDVRGSAVQAEDTVTFFTPKMGHLLFPGRKLTGELTVARLVSGKQLPALDGRIPELIEASDFQAWLPPRAMDAHKGDCGKALLVAGSAGMVGAAIISARACLRSGAGLLSVAVPQGIAGALWAAVPECMAHPLEEKDGMLCRSSFAELDFLARNKTCVAVGPGLGRGEEAGEVVRRVFTYGLPTVADADALVALAGDLSMMAGCPEVVLTPHPGEMARLCGASVPDILADPLGCARNFAEKTGVVVLLKGASSVIASPDGCTRINVSGGPQLAKGGSGDSLTGIVLAYLAQGMPAYDAAAAAALTLGTAAQCVQKSVESVIAGDVVEAIDPAIASLRNR